MVLGNFDILDKIVFSFFIAIPVLLFSVALFLRGKYLLSLILLALSFYLHAAVSFFVSSLYVFYFIINYKEINKQLILSGLLSVVLIIPVIISSISVKPLTTTGLNEWMHLLRLRVEGHFFPLSWSFLVYFTFFLTCVMFLISYYHNEKTKNKKVLVMFFGSLLLLLFGFIFTEIYPVMEVIQMSLFRGWVIFRVIAYIYIIYFIVDVFRHSSSRLKKTIALLAAIWLVSAALIPMFIGSQRGIIANEFFGVFSSIWR